MAFGYERRCPNGECGRPMSYEKCAGMVYVACLCGYRRIIKDEWEWKDSKWERKNLQGKSE
jgi:DNA-directed RNA polymerase subunit RPC12/RpoP